ncbi:MAG: hypothetical protein CVU27_04130 [Betaproteobacteria bacterium HGW-Betaproteobacteria-20]|nr:MAG: hypothetical protein CVU27_04130 [Betaproteobacteria bacterium HGW-Betaproteobacteria-20]
MPLSLVPGEYIQVVVPGVRAPTYRWLTLGIAMMCLLAVLGMAGQMYGNVEIVTLLHKPLQIVFVVLAILLVLNAIRFVPRSGTLAYRRLPLLLLLAVPWLAALLGGPLGLIEISNDPLIQQRVLLLQFSAFLASLLLPFILLIPMRGARHLTLTVGALNLLVCFFIVAVSSILAQSGA